jgi:hypothetical protein
MVDIPEHSMLVTAQSVLTSTKNPASFSDAGRGCIELQSRRQHRCRPLRERSSDRMKVRIVNDIVAESGRILPLLLSENTAGVSDQPKPSAGRSIMKEPRVARKVRLQRQITYRQDMPRVKIARAASEERGRLVGVARIGKAYRTTFPAKRSELSLGSQRDDRRGTFAVVRLV